MTATPKLLDGVRVLDLTSVLAGPFAAYQLVLLGADVVKVELPGRGDLARSLGADPALNSDLMGASFVAQNSGKRSVALDLKTGTGRAAFTGLVREADVLLENFRPGVLDRLGFDAARLAELNPRLVTCAVSGFGADGPLRDRPAYDQIIQGLSGMMATTGHPGTDPLRAGYPVADTLGGMAAAMAVCAGLAGVARTGRGCRLDVSMLETAITALGWVVSNQLVAGHAHQPAGNDNMTAAPSGTFRTGAGLLNIAANEQRQFDALCRVLGRPDLPEDPRFTGREDRKHHRAELTAELEAALADRDAATWSSLLAAAGVPAGEVLGIQDALDQDQIQARGLLHRVRTSDGREFTVLGNGVHVDGHAGAPPGGPPLLGEHDEQLLGESGWTERDQD